MRRFLGLKKSKQQQPTTTNSNAPLETVTNTAQPPPPPVPAKQQQLEEHARGPDKRNAAIGLGIVTTTTESNNNNNNNVTSNERKSKHVHYESGSPSASPSASANNNLKALHPQPSFESRHGTNCFPALPLPLARSPSDTSATDSANTSAALTPAHPAPLLRHQSHSHPHQDNNSNNQQPPAVGVGYDLQLQRTTSPLSFSPSVTASYSIRGASPYAYGVHQNPSLQRLAERDPTQIYAPLTWSELVHDDLVQNISPRERTRQEILWEVVASEERYVAELRSLVELYVNPLLHPLLASPPPTPPTSMTSPSPSTSASPTPYSPSQSPPPPPPSSSASQSPLPIAARFARSDSSASASSSASPFGPWVTPSSSRGPSEQDNNNSGPWLNPNNNATMASIPDMDDDSDTPPASRHRGHAPGARSHASLPAPPPGRNHHGGMVLPASPSSVSLAATVPDRAIGSSASGGSSAFSRGMAKWAWSNSIASSLRPRHPLKPPVSGSKLHKGKVPKEVLAPPVLPQGLRSVLESLPEMLKGHEELSFKLKDQWVRAFPLVRGLALIWSDQPWFLDTYARYILSLEEALGTLDRLLPSAHSPRVHLEKEDKKLARFIMDLEERATMEGEAGLAIAVSKPLMRLGKLPLLMQSLLYHTDATTVEYEKTRAMALEVDALVRSIEDEKVEEEEREKVRDVLARIDGIKDKALMAPRSTRVLIQEVPANPASPTNPPSPSQTPRRAVSESTPAPSSSSKAGTNSGSAKLSTPPQASTKKSIKRLSDLLPKDSNGAGGKNDWFVIFSDVTIRCVKTGTTDIPGGFSREKEKQGKQGKTKKKGKTRNLYRFVKVEKWEMSDGTKAGLVSMEDIHRARQNGEDVLEETSDEDDYEDDDDNFDAESRMSFTYEADDPKPVAPRNFKSDAALGGRPRSSASRATTGRSVSSTTRQVVARQTPAKAKFGTRGASLGPAPAGVTTIMSNSRFQAPTAASIARANAPSAGGSTGIATGARTTPNLAPSSRVVSPAAGGAGGGRTGSASAAAPAKRGLSSPAMPSSQPPQKTLAAHGREDSTMRVYEAYWDDNVPFPSTGK
ncbi:Dbl homology domain-containing protein [Meredithblackwellia eburnea MCA 4105]